MRPVAVLLEDHDRPAGGRHPYEATDERMESGTNVDQKRATSGPVHPSHGVPASPRDGNSPEVIGLLPRIARRLESPSTRLQSMELTPTRPPGRASRKALAFTTEIHRLRVAGYSFEAIRLMLREAGVEVSNTTVKREAAKTLPTEPPAPSRDALKALPPPDALAVQGAARETHAPPGTYLGDARSGKEIAEAFMKGRITNPLLQEGPSREGRRD